MFLNTNSQIVFYIERIYTKGVSFESPGSPGVFRDKWRPNIKLDLDTWYSLVQKNVYEVVLHVIVRVMLDKDVAFICEVHQAGIFFISGLDDINLSRCLAEHCPEVLYPYARECISSQISRGTFPQLNLAPMNFSAVFNNYTMK